MYIQEAEEKTLGKPLGAALRRYGAVAACFAVLIVAAAVFDTRGPIEPALTGPVVGPPDISQPPEVVPEKVTVDMGQVYFNAEWESGGLRLQLAVQRIERADVVKTIASIIAGTAEITGETTFVEYTKGGACFYSAWSMTGPCLERTAAHTAVSSANSRSGRANAAQPVI